MTYPRALALSEVGWTQMQQRSWKSFTDRLEGQLSYLLHQGVNYRPPVELANLKCRLSIANYQLFTIFAF